MELQIKQCSTCRRVVIKASAVRQIVSKLISKCRLRNCVRSQFAACLSLLWCVSISNHSTEARLQNMQYCDSSGLALHAITAVDRLEKLGYSEHQFNGKATTAMHTVRDY